MADLKKGLRMSNENYWHQVTNARLSRRRALIGTGGGALGAAFLAACGGGGSKDSSSGGSGSATKSTDKSGLIYEPVDSTANAKSGGTIKSFYTAEILHFDALLSNSSSTVNDASVFTYPRMLKYALTKYPKPNEGGIEGDTMESYEVSPDKLTVTFKMRQGMKWDARPPTSGRVMDTQDVLFSWKKFGSVNASAVNLVYDNVKSPGAPVESLTAPDDKTLVMKLKQPDGALLTLLAGWDQMYIMPRESDGGFDPRADVRGYGPWQLEDYRSGAYTYWKKNPDYYVKGRPYADRLERALVPEFATRLAQFKAGNIHTDVVEQSQDAVVQLKKDAPQTQLVLGAGGYGKNYNPVVSANIIFGYEGNSPFKDVRVRQAMSMALDRDAFADTLDNRKPFADSGLDNGVVFNTALSPAWNGYWLDPKGKDFGANSKYYDFNIAEAKKLMAAAGFANGTPFDFYYNKEATYGPTYAKTVEVYTSMFQEVGLKANLQGLPYNQWLANYHYGYLPQDFAAGKVKGFNGIGLAAERQRYTAVLSVYGLVHPQGDAFHGATTDGNNPVQGDPKLNDQLAKLRQETDKAKIEDGMKDVQRYMAQQAYYIPKPSNSIPFTVWWPALANVGAFTSSPVGANRWAEHNLAWWIDTTKAPFVKS